MHIPKKKKLTITPTSVKIVCEHSNHSVTQKFWVEDGVLWHRDRSGVVSKFTALTGPLKKLLNDNV